MLTHEKSGLTCQQVFVLHVEFLKPNDQHHLYLHPSSACRKIESSEEEVMYKHFRN